MTDSRSAFFYGTLMVPQVLHRVCHGGMDPQNPIFATHKLKTYPAVLHDYQRHRVRHADYPAILPKTGSTVRGTYVTGLTDADIWRLDIFEGWMYRRDKVQVRILTVFGDSEGKDNVEGELAEAETYVWSASPQDLEDREWDFTEFQREKMHFWVGADGEEEYADVDEAVAAVESPYDGTGGRGANGHITNALKREHKLRDVANTTL